MVVKKVVGLSEEEYEALMAAGKILKAIKEAKQAGDIDELNSEANNIVEALKKVCTEIVG